MKGKRAGTSLRRLYWQKYFDRASPFTRSTINIMKAMFRLTLWRNTERVLFGKRAKLYNSKTIGSHSNVFTTIAPKGLKVLALWHHWFGGCYDIQITVYQTHLKSEEFDRVILGPPQSWLFMILICRCNANHFKRYKIWSRMEKRRQAGLCQHSFHSLNL